MAQPAEVAVAVRIPAWKKIGLKLASDSESKKRKVADIDGQAQGTETNGTSHWTPSVHKRSKKHAASPSHDISVSTRSPSHARPPLRRKKSVTFTEETKTEDGDSAQKLYQDWNFSQQGGEEQFTPEEAAQFPPPKVHPGNLEVPLIPTQSSTKKKKSKSKKRKRELTSESNVVDQVISTSRKITEGETLAHGYIVYVVQFHTARASWKFNKAHQSSLLKHAFDIPTEHHEAFASYIKGLKGQAVVRLIEAAKSVLRGAEGDEDTGDEKTDNMEDPAERKRSQDRAMKRELQRTKIRLREKEDLEGSNTEEFKQKLKKRKMAEHILQVLSDADLPTENDHNQNAPSTNGVATGSRAFTAPFAGTRTVFTDDKLEPKRRKIREKKPKTGFPDDDVESISSVGSISSRSTSTASSSSSSDETEAEASSIESGSTLGRNPNLSSISGRSSDINTSDDSDSDTDSNSDNDSESGDGSELSDDTDSADNSESSDESGESDGNDE